MSGVGRVLLWMAVVACLLGVGTAAAEAAPGFPPSFPPDQNQLPQLPREPDLYDLLPTPPPDKDPWYNDPPNMAGMKPGTVVRSRTVQTRLLGVPVPVFTKQILFRSNDVHNNPIVTATSVLVPGVPWRGSARPVISYQEAIDSTDSSCNPSHTLRTGTNKEAAVLAAWLIQGMAVNMPDFDGKFNTFTTFAEGKMVLDSLRAVKNDTSLGLRKSGFALIGYSGGGSGSIRAAELRESYAPDVKLLGTSVGGTPADLVKLVDYATEPNPGLTGASSFTMWLGIAALAREYPKEFDVTRLLTKQGQQIVADTRERCVYSAAVSGAYRPLSAYFQPGKSLKTEPGIQRVLRDNSLGGSIPDSPVLWYHGFFDELIPPSTVTPVVTSLYQRGADIRFVTAPAGEHLITQGVMATPAIAWITAVARGIPPGPRFNLPFQPLPRGFPGT